MKTFNITRDNQTTTYNIPESWDDVSIARFCEMFRTDVSDLHPIFKSVRHMSILAGIEEQDIMDLTAEQYNQVAECFEFMNTEVTTPMQESIQVEGETYYLKTDFNALTFGEQVSIEIIMEKANGNVLGCMDELLCVFLRRKDDSGVLEPFKTGFMDRANIFAEIPVTAVYQLFTFFLNGDVE